MFEKHSVIASEAKQSRKAKHFAGLLRFARNDEVGFTLIEVLIALVIVSLSFAAVMYSINNASRNYIHLHDKTAATWVATNVIAQAQTNQLHGTISGVENMLGKEWSWQLNVKTTSNPLINELQVTVKDQQSGKQVTQLMGYVGLSQ